MTMGLNLQVVFMVQLKLPSLNRTCLHSRSKIMHCRDAGSTLLLRLFTVSSYSLTGFSCQHSFYGFQTHNGLAMFVDKKKKKL